MFESSHCCFWTGRLRSSGLSTFCSPHHIWSTAFRTQTAVGCEGCLPFPPSLASAQVLHQDAALQETSYNRIQVPYSGCPLHCFITNHHLGEKDFPAPRFHQPEFWPSRVVFLSCAAHEQLAQGNIVWRNPEKEPVIKTFESCVLALNMFQNREINEILTRMYLFSCGDDFSYIP